MNRPTSQLDNKVLQLCILLLGIVYGGFSSSTPDAVGIAEIIVLASLIYIVFLGCKYSFRSPNNFFALTLILFFMAYIILVYLFRQNDLTAFLRDVIPLIYMTIPFFVYPYIKTQPEKFIKVFEMFFLIVGFFFSFRYLTTDTSQIFNVGKVTFAGDDNYYFGDPAVLISAILFPCYFFHAITQKKYILSILCFSCFIVVFLALSLVLLRAQIVLALFSILMLFFIYSRKYIFVFIFSLVFFVTLISISLPLLEGIWNLIEIKTQTSGLNKRDLEFKAVMTFSASSIDRLLFGSGLGGVISSEVSGGDEWRFVHNMFAYYLFKTGLFGLIFYSIFFFYAIKHLFSSLNFSWMSHPDLYKSYAVIFSNFIINGLLEAGFKSVSFGIFLCLALSYKCYFDNQKLTN